MQSGPVAFGAAVLTASAMLRRRVAHLARPPIPAKKHHIVKFGAVEGEIRGEGAMQPVRTVEDPYFWMRSDDRNDEEVLDLLRRENAHTDFKTRHLSELKSTLYKEFRGRMRETDMSVPGPWGPYEYFTRTFEGQGYAVHCRRARGGGADSEEVVLDENEVARGAEYCSVDTVVPSPDHRFVAYAVDPTGAEEYEVRVRDVRTGQDLPDVVRGAESDVVWHPDGKSFFYLSADATRRPCMVWQHVLGTESAAAGDGDSDSDSDSDSDDSEGGEESKAETADDANDADGDSDSEGGRETGGIVWPDPEVPVRGVDRLLFVDTNGEFFVDILTSANDRFLIVESSSTDTSEIHFLELGEHPTPSPHQVAEAAERGARGAGALTGMARHSGSVWHSDALVPVQPRRTGLRYDVDVWGDRVFIVTNKGGELAQALQWTPLSALGESNWRHVYTYDPAITLTTVVAFRRFLLLVGREEGLKQVWVLYPDGSEMDHPPRPASAAGSLRSLGPGLEGSGVTAAHRIEFADPLYSASLCTASSYQNVEFDATTLRISYSSLVHPPATLEYDVRARTHRVLKQNPVPGFDRAKYDCARVHALASDGTRVPVSLLWRKDAPAPPSGRPTYMYGYGSYGSCMEPGFRSFALSLADRGVLFAIAHVRGGGEMGRAWYETQGSLLTKRNTFTDFISCAEHLVVRGLADRMRIAVSGASAGGLLVGAVLNMRPDLFRCAVSEVGFVDVMATMSDASIPLTTSEWTEWGNPNVAEFHDYIRSYCPVTNVHAAKYPPVFATCGLHDPRVGYWEPLKWVTLLRERAAPGSGPFLLRAQMAGHFSSSDRYAYLHDEAECYAFALHELGATELV